MAIASSPFASSDQFVQRFCQWFREEHGTLSNTYLVADFQVAGNSEDGLIVRTCYLPVLEGQPDEPHTMLLSYAAYPEQVPDELLRERLASAQGLAGVTVEQLRTTGTEVREALDLWRHLISKLPADTPLVGHALYHSGLPVLRRHFTEWLGDTTFDPDTVDVWDTGLMHKGLVSGLMVNQGESVGRFHRRVNEARIYGVRWARDYLLKQYNPVVPVSSQDPSFGLWFAHAVYQVQRQVVNDVP